MCKVILYCIFLKLFIKLFTYRKFIPRSVCIIRLFLKLAMFNLYYTCPLSWKKCPQQVPSQLQQYAYTVFYSETACLFRCGIYRFFLMVLFILFEKQMDGQFLAL